jgi:hypothetical protein
MVHTRKRFQGAKRFCCTPTKRHEATTTTFQPWIRLTWVGAINSATEYFGGIEISM